MPSGVFWTGWRPARRSPGGLRDGYQLSDSGYDFDNITDTARLKWTTQFGTGLANEFLSGYSTIRDKRILGSDLPLISSSRSICSMC